MKAIIFDFDGTLTKKDRNIWKAIFEDLGLDTKSEKSEYKTQFRDFLAGKINYQQWCDETLAVYRANGFSEKMFYNLADQIVLLDGFSAMVQKLNEKGLKLHIVSGNFVEIIEYVLGDYKKYFDSISANHIEFDQNGIISKIIGTNYDFEGKAKFIKTYAQNNGIAPQDILFVGNGDNDEWVYLSGCKTLCINPDKTDCNDKTKWHHAIEHLSNLQEILSVLDIKE